MDPKHLHRLALAADEQHREGMRTIHESLFNAHMGENSPTVSSRRGFLRRAATSTTVIGFGTAAFTLPAMLGLGGATAAAQGSTTTTAKPFTTLPDDDLTLIRFAESVERVAAAAYVAAVDTRLFDPLAVEVCRTFGRHHTEHAEALLGLVAGDKVGSARFGKEPAAPNPVLLSAIERQLANATSTTDRQAAAKAVFEVAYGLEEGAASTYLLALGAFETQAVAGAAATILPVEAQHALVIGQVLELPDDVILPAFQALADAFSPTDYALR